MPLKLILIVIGFCVSALLAWKQIFKSDLPFCEIATCDIVLGSQWAYFLGVPFSFIGLLVYSFLFFSSFSCGKFLNRVRKIILTSSVFVSLFLTIISVTTIKATCLYCLISFFVFVLLFYLEWRTRALRFSTELFPGIIVAIFVFIVIFQQEKDSSLSLLADPKFKDLAQHLTTSEAKFYGASWCQACLAQKRLFGSSQKFLPYVECSPNGKPSSRSTECLLKEINSYPTWIIGGRRFEKVLSIDRLKMLSGYKEKAPQKDERD